MSFFHYPSSIFICLALAIAKASLGTSFVIVEPAAIYALSLTFTGDTKLVLHPIKALLPIIVLYFDFPS